MKNEIPSIWSSLEVDCITRDFSYLEYLDFHTKIEARHAPVGEKFYKLISVGINEQLAPSESPKKDNPDVVDWNTISEMGLLERINREIMHPLGLAVFRVVETGVSGGALVSPDGEWEYPEDE